MHGLHIESLRSGTSTMAETFDYHDFDPSENIRPALLDLGIPHDEEDVHYQETTQNKDFKGLNGLSYVSRRVNVASSSIF